MSIFDPQQLYYHRQKATHKGQVIQKKPVNIKGTYSQSMIPGAIHLLEQYDYHIYPSSWRPYYCYIHPFNVKQDNLSGTSYEFKFNDLYRYLKPILPNLQAFIDLHPPGSENSSHVAVAITNAIVISYNYNVTVQFYNNATMTINNQNSITTQPNSTCAFMYGPNLSNSQYYLGYDKDSTQTSSTTWPGEIVVRTRAANTDLPGIISHIDIENKWNEINSTTGLKQDIMYCKAFANDSLTNTSIQGYIFQGYLLIELNN